MGHLTFHDPLWLVALLVLPLLFWLRGRRKVPVLLVPFAAAWYRPSLASVSRWPVALALTGQGLAKRATDKAAGTGHGDAVSQPGLWCDDPCRAAAEYFLDRFSYHHAGRFNHFVVNAGHLFISLRQTVAARDRLQLPAGWLLSGGLCNGR